jgi:hypothetical protein
MRLRAVGVVLALLLPASAGAQRAPGITDVYGYRASDSISAGAECAHLPIVLDAGAFDLLLTDGDDGVAELTLESAFPLYGINRQSLQVSANGYLAATNLDAPEALDDGADFSADCPLPAVPDNASAGLTRIYALHADLELDAQSQLRSQYFASCPRASAAAQDGACSVVEWRGVRRLGSGPSGSRATLQAVLYHADGEIALQYLALPLGMLPAATVGVQDVALTSGVAWSCGAALPAAGQSVCLFDESVAGISYQVEVTAEPLAGGSVSGGGTYAAGAEVSVGAQANAGYRFIDWREGGVPQSTDSTYVFTASSDRSLMAMFVLREDAIFADGFESASR